jgi:hypothetical protein
MTFQVSQVELGKAAKTVYNLPPPPLNGNKTIENPKTDNKNDVQEPNVVVSDKSKGAARGGVGKNLKNVPSKVVRTIKTTQNKVLVYMHICVHYMCLHTCKCKYSLTQMCIYSCIHVHMNKYFMYKWIYTYKYRCMSYGHL